MCASNAALVDVDPARPFTITTTTLFSLFGSVGQNTHKDNQASYRTVLVTECNSNAIFHNYIRQHEGLDGRTHSEA